MAQVELIMPKLGESITEATILSWKKKVGDHVDEEETILEIATDKVDSEVPSPASGIITQILFEENAVVPIGKIIAVISTEASEGTISDVGIGMSDAGGVSVQSEMAPDVGVRMSDVGNTRTNADIVSPKSEIPIPTSVMPKQSDSNRFYSPLVRTIAKEENVSVVELDKIEGSGQGGRVTKSDILNFVQNRTTSPTSNHPITQSPITHQQSPITHQSLPIAHSISGNVEIIEMDRMRKLIADHMVMSKHVAPHVTSFVEADVTNLVNWRNKVKGEFQKKYGENMTFTPIFIEAICKTLRDFPMVNSSVDGSKIIIKKDLNIGMATAMPNGNLIVPVIKGADMFNLLGLTKQVNDLANRARNNKLKPEEVQGGTFTLTNVGGFGNIMGTPIINQPQVAILAVGVIKKRPAVIETEFGDVIAVRQMMYLSMSYDHRVVDGSLGGTFLKRVADYLEQFDVNRSV